MKEAQSSTHHVHVLRAFPSRMDSHSIGEAEAASENGASADHTYAHHSCLTGIFSPKFHPIVHSTIGAPHPSALSPCSSYTLRDYHSDHPPPPTVAASQSRVPSAATTTSVAHNGYCPKSSSNPEGQREAYFLSPLTTSPASRRSSRPRVEVADSVIVPRGDGVHGKSHELACATATSTSEPVAASAGMRPNIGTLEALAVTNTANVITEGGASICFPSHGSSEPPSIMQTSAFGAEDCVSVPGQSVADTVVVVAAAVAVAAAAQAQGNKMSWAQRKQANEGGGRGVINEDIPVPYVRTTTKSPFVNGLVVIWSTNWNVVGHVGKFLGLNILF